MRSLKCLTVAVISNLLLCFPAACHEVVDKDEVISEAQQREFDIEMSELELQIAELEVDEAKVEVDKAKLQMVAAEEQGDVRPVEHAKLELQHAILHVEMRKLHAEMRQLDIKRAKADLQHLRHSMPKLLGQPTKVRVEYVEELDGVIIRGKETDVKKIKALLEDATQPKND